MKLVPRLGMVIIDPDTNQALSPHGEEKELTTFWFRRLRDGDVVEIREEQENRPVIQSEPARRKNKKKSTEGT